jgi:hypothetical protein
MPNKYWIGGTGNNWSTAANWSLTSGVVNPTSVPTPADDVFFDAGSGSGTVTTTAGATCLSANFNGFIGTFNANTNWSIGTSLTFSSTMFITGTGNILKTASGGTWTFNTKTYTGGWVYHIAGGSATTIADNIAFVGSLTGGFNANINATSTKTITIGGNFTGLYTSLTNINFVMNGSGILDLDLRSNGNSSLIIDTLLGTITQSATVSLFSMTFTYVRGGWTSTAPIRFGGLGSANIMNNVSTIVFHSMTFLANGGQTVTLNSDMYVAGNLSTISLPGIVNGTGRLYIRGNISTPVSGTATIEMDGTTNATITASSIANSLIINKSGTPTPATVTLNSFTWGAAGRTLQRTAGNINVGTSTVTIPAAAVTINDFTFWNLTVNSGAAIIQNLLNTINNNLTLNGNAAFQGTAGWTCANLICSTAGITITLQNLITYTTTTSVNMLGTNAQKILMTSNAAGARTIWTFNGNTQSMVYVSATRIDSDLGQTIWSFGGVIALTPLPEATRNWNPGTKPETQGITFVN